MMIRSSAHEHGPEPLDWNLLRTFTVIIQQRSISKAAEKLSLTQPAVSLALKRLEDQLGHKLVERSARRFHVTDVGKRLYAEAIEIQSHISRLREAIRDASEEMTGQVRLVLGSRIHSVLLDRILERYHQAHPQVSFRIDVLPSAEISSIVQRGLATAGLCLLRTPPPNVRAELFMRQQYGLYCGRPHRLFGRPDVTLMNLRNEPFVTFHSDQLGEVLSPLAIFREQHGFDGPIVGSSVNLDEIRRMAFVGFGIGLLPMHIAEADVRAGLLWQLPPTHGIGPIDVFLIWRPTQNMSRAEQLFLDMAISEMACAPMTERLGDQPD